MMGIKSFNQAANILFLVVSLLLSGAVTIRSFPQATITNGLIKATLYLPDATDGYYRATRFDWSGVIPELESEHHRYSGQWFEKYAPKIHDAIMGPVESFSPLGFNEVAEGNGFVQIGVGILQKGAKEKYNAFQYYPIIDHGKWRIHRQDSRITFSQEVTGGPYPYHYDKSIELLPNKSSMRLHHQLRNLGRKTMDVTVYDHNMWMLDHQITGPGCVIQFPFQMTAVPSHQDQFYDFVQIQGREISFRKLLGKQDRVRAVISGFSDKVSDYDIRMENRNTGAGIRITSDKPLSKLVFWACSTTFCPEPYIHLKVAPGQEVEWTLTYQFY